MSFSMFVTWVLVGVLMGVLAAMSLPALAQDENPTVEAGELAPGETITIDGHLDEAAWQHAGSVCRLRE